MFKTFFTEQNTHLDVISSDTCCSHKRTTRSVLFKPSKIVCDLYLYCRINTESQNHLHKLTAYCLLLQHLCMFASYFIANATSYATISI